MELADKILKGNVQAAARLMSKIENNSPDAVEELNLIYPHTGRAYIIGVTGPPGAGKSLLCDCLIRAFRAKQMKVGVVAVDPSSAFTGGAILGDRIRMRGHCSDPDVFIRSLATRGWIGGLSRATVAAVHVMDAMGKDIILIETVGSGQIEIDITRAADTTILVLTPSSGDNIQMMKAGILEAADVFTINKSDLSGAEAMKDSLEMALSLKEFEPEGWMPRVVATSAILGMGIPDLVVEIDRHRHYLINSGKLDARQRQRAKFELIETLEGFLKDFMQRVDKGDYLDRLVDDLLRGKTNPQQATLEIASRFAREMRSGPADIT